MEPHGEVSRVEFRSSSQSREVVTECDRRRVSGEQRRFAHELLAVRVVEEHVAWCQQEPLNVDRPTGHPNDARPIPGSIRRDVVHADLRDAILGPSTRGESGASFKE